MIHFGGLCIILLVLGHQSNGQECNQQGYKALDDNFAKLLTIGNSGRRFPENHGHLPKYCEQSKQYLEDIEQFKNKCMKDATKQMASVLVYAMKNVQKNMCRKGSKSIIKLMSASPCVNRGNNEISRCYAQMIDNLQGIQNLKDDKKKVPMICCTFHCIEKRLHNVASCNETTIDITINFVKGAGGDFVDLFCGDYTEGSDACSKLGPNPRKRKDQKRTRSFMLPTIAIFNSIKD